MTQGITYAAGGGGIGQPSQVSENDNGVNYTCNYLYSAAGDRCESSYTTPNGTVNWGYGDYVDLGTPEKPNRAFQTLNKLDGNSNPTSEELHYEYDTMGRLTNAAFMQTPQTGHTGYSSQYPAAVRARAFYNYDVSGVLTNIEHYWDTWNGTKYTSVPILGAVCSYDAYKLLKTQTQFYAKNSGNNNWALQRTETYGYDTALDTLTGASYNDGLPNANPTWTFDAAGNRTDTGSAFDNLNRATAIQGTACTNDVLGTSRK